MRHELIPAQQVQQHGVAVSNGHVSNVQQPSQHSMPNNGSTNVRQQTQPQQQVSYN